MKIKDIIFRKMTILYFVIFLVLGLAFGVLLYDYNLNRVVLEDNVTTNYSVILTSGKELNDIPEASQIKKVKKVGLYYLIVDDSLTGNECITANTTDATVGEIFNYNNEIVCTVKDYSLFTKPVQEVSVSKEYYDSFKVDNYYYLVTPKSIKDMKKMKKNYTEARTLIIFGVEDFDCAYAEMINLLIILVSTGLIIILLTIVAYINIRGFVNSKSPKTKNNKKTKETSSKNIVYSTLIVTLIPLVLSYVITKLFIVDLIFNF